MRWRIVEADPRGKMKAERHDLAAIPPDVAEIFAVRRPDPLPIDILIALMREPGRRPRKRPRLVQLSNVGDIQAQVNEPPAVTPRGADARHAHSVAREELPHAGAVEARGRTWCRGRCRAARPAPESTRSRRPSRCRRARCRTARRTWYWRGRTVRQPDAIRIDAAASAAHARRLAPLRRPDVTNLNVILKGCLRNDCSAHPVPHRRQQPDVPRVSRDPRSQWSRRQVHERRVRLRDDAAQADRRSLAGLHRGVVRSGRADVPRCARLGLQGQSHADARRSRRADHMGARRVRGAGRADRQRARGSRPTT